METSIFDTKHKIDPQNSPKKRKKYLQLEYDIDDKIDEGFHG